MVMYAKVRRMRLRDGLPISEIARRTGLARNTIKAWLRGTSRSEMRDGQRMATAEFRLDRTSPRLVLRLHQLSGVSNAGVKPEITEALKILQDIPQETLAQLPEPVALGSKQAVGGSALFERAVRELGFDVLDRYRPCLQSGSGKSELWDALNRHYRHSGSRSARR